MNLILRGASAEMTLNYIVRTGNVQNGIEKLHAHMQRPKMISNNYARFMHHVSEAHPLGFHNSSFEKALNYYVWAHNNLDKIELLRSHHASFPG